MFKIAIEKNLSLDVSEASVVEFVHTGIIFNLGFKDGSKAVVLFSVVGTNYHESEGLQLTNVFLRTANVIEIQNESYRDYLFG